jgi:hypothetical protein
VNSEVLHRIDPSIVWAFVGLAALWLCIALCTTLPSVIPVVFGWIKGLWNRGHGVYALLFCMALPLLFSVFLYLAGLVH